MRLSIAFLALICLPAQATTITRDLQADEPQAVAPLDEVTPAAEETKSKTWLRASDRGQFDVQSILDSLNAKREIFREKRAAFRDKLSAELQGNEVGAAQLDSADLQNLISNLLLEENLALISEISAALAMHTGSTQTLIAAVISQKENIMKLFESVMGEAMPTFPAGETTLPAGETTLPAGETTLPEGGATIPAGEQEAIAALVEKKLSLLNRLIQANAAETEAGAVAAQGAPTQGDVQDAFILSTVLSLLYLPKLGFAMGFATWAFTFVALVFLVDDTLPFQIDDIIDVIDGGTEDD